MMSAQTAPVVNNDLNKGQQSIVVIAALTATGNLQALKPQLTLALEAGMSVNEINEVLVQLYAYCGFPRSLNAINTFMALLEERKAAGIADVQGKEASPITEADKYETGKQTLQVLTRREEKGPKTGANAFAPVIDTFLKEHLFADIFSRDILSYQQRELTTIAALAAMTGTEPQLRAHIGMGMNTGLTENQLRQTVALMEKHISSAQAETAGKVLTKVLEAAK